MTSSPTAATVPQKTNTLWVGGILLAYCALRLPSLIYYYDYHYDEHFYTDGVLEMMRTGDYLTPRYPDTVPLFSSEDNGRPDEKNSAGVDRTLCFNKPALTYFLILASFKTFGVSAFTSRLPFLIGGLLFLFLSYRFAKLILDDGDAALTVMALLAGNFNVFYHLPYAITDGMLSLFVLLAHYGFYHVLVLGDTRRRFLYYAYAGAGLALATKGVPGILPTATAGLFAIWLWIWGGRRNAIRSLISIPAMLLGFFLAFGWMLLEWNRFGNIFLRGLMNDQVTTRLEGKNILSGMLHEALINLPYYPAVLFEYTLPFSPVIIYIFIRYRKTLRTFFTGQGIKWLYVFGSIGLTYLFYLPPNIHRMRYLMPVMPFILMVVAASFMTVANQLNLQRLWSRMTTAIAGADLLAGIALIVFGFGYPRWLPVGIAGAAAAAITLLLNFKAAPGKRLVIASLAVVLAYVMQEWSIDREAAMCPSATVVSSLASRDFTSGTVGLGPRAMWELPAQVRVLCGGKIDFKLLDKGGPQSAQLLRAADLPKAGEGDESLEIVEIGPGFKSFGHGLFPGRDNDRLMWMITKLNGTHEKFLQIRRDRYILLKRMIVVQ